MVSVGIILIVGGILIHPLIGVAGTCCLLVKLFGSFDHVDDNKKAELGTPRQTVGKTRRARKRLKKKR